MADIESSKKLLDRINELPGDDGWYKRDGFEAYSAIAAKLLKKGFSEAEAGNLLEECYWAVSSEYGD